MDQAKIGKFIAEKRRQRGLTQRTLAEQLLVSDKAVSKWERGICLPNIELLSPLAELLDVNVKTLLTGEDEAKAEESLPEDKIVINTVELYTKENHRKEKKKRFIFCISLTIVTFTLVVLPLYSKYNVSRYDSAAQNAWSKAGTTVVELLDTGREIKDAGYRIELETYYNLKYLVSGGMDAMAEFQTETKRGEKVNALIQEMDCCVNETMRQIEINAMISFENGGSSYRCSEEEVVLIDQFLSRLPQLYDKINEEMGIVSPGISQLY